MKVFVLTPGEQWICDRFFSEWRFENEDITFDSGSRMRFDLDGRCVMCGEKTCEHYPKIPYPVVDDSEIDIIWLLADWCFDHIPIQALREKKVLCSVHHISEHKWDSKEEEKFKFRDQFVDLYHVPCEITKQQIQPFTKTPIQVQPFWVNGKLWHDITDEDRLQRMKKEMGLEVNEFVIGSFQRDTEGNDLESPKLEKGPDILADFVEIAKNNLRASDMVPVVLLGGWRRDYLRNRLDKMGVRYVDRSGDNGQSMPSLRKLNEMYNCLDLYIVSARWEGGPQAIVEAAITRTPIISTDVGVAKHILSTQSIATRISAEALMDAMPDVDYAYEKVQPYLIPQGFSAFRDMLESL